MPAKQAYIKEIHSLSVAPGRLKERIQGRIVIAYEETLRMLKTKLVAIIVDKANKLQSVLMIEAWSPEQQRHAKKHLLENLGRVVVISNAKLVLRGKSLVYFDRECKIAWDNQTTVELVPAADDKDFPHALPLLPLIDNASTIHASAMISIEAAVHETGTVQERNIAGEQKKVCNVCMASGDKSMDTAFWGAELAEQICQMPKGTVCRLDWMILIPQGDGKFKLTSTRASTITKQEGPQADAVTNNLAQNIQNMSPVYGRSRLQKLTDQYSQGSLSMVDHLRQLNPSEGAYAAGTLLVPAVFVKDIRSLNKTTEGLCYYMGCNECRKQMEHKADEAWTCSTHGQNEGKKIYGIQLTLQDPEHKTEVAMWEECLKACCAKTQHTDIDAAETLQGLATHLHGRWLCARFSYGMKTTGSGMYLDLFDLQEQVNEEGGAAAFQYQPKNVIRGVLGIPPSCCQHASANDLGQLLIRTEKTERQAEQVHFLCEVLTSPKVKVMQDMDGLEVRARVSCCCCQKELTLVWAGLADTVAHMMQTQAETRLSVVVQAKLEDSTFEPWSVSILPKTVNTSFEKIFKYSAQQYLDRVHSESETTSSAAHRQDIAELLSNHRSPKRLKVQHTLEAAGL